MCRIKPSQTNKTQAKSGEGKGASRLGGNPCHLKPGTDDGMRNIRPSNHVAVKPEREKLSPGKPGRNACQLETAGRRLKKTGNPIGLVNDWENGVFK